MINQIDVTQVRPGDLADHVSGDLDPRAVTRIDPTTNHVWLDILGAEAGPYPASNYTYLREDTSL